MGSKLIRVRRKAWVGRGGKNEIKVLTQLITGRGKEKWNKKTGEEYSMGCKVQTNSEQIGVLLEKYSNNHGILPN